MNDSAIVSILVSFMPNLTITVLMEKGEPMTDTGRVIICVTALICTTFAAMHFNSAGILWWYAVPLLLWME